MERDAVLALIRRHHPKQSNLPYVVRPPTFVEASFYCDLVDIHPRNNGDVRVTFVVAYEDRHQVFMLTDAWGANLRVTVTRAEDYGEGVPRPQITETNGTLVIDLNARPLP